MKKILSIFLLLFALLPLTAAEKVRIVSLAPALTEIVCYLGGEENLVGRSSACDYPASVKKIPAVGRFGMPEIERILACRPDWVIGNDMINHKLAAKLQELNIEVNIAQINSLEDYLYWLKLIGSKLGKSKKAAELAADTRRKCTVLQQAKKLDLKVLWVVNEKPLIVAGKGTLLDKNLSLMQLENAVAAQKGYYKCSPEWLLTQKIDLVIWGIPGKPQQRRLWKRVTAVQKKQVVHHHIFDPVTRPGPRYLEAVIKLRKEIEKVRSF